MQTTPETGPEISKMQFVSSPLTDLVLKVKTIYFQETIVEKKEITRGSLS